jgi:hypothetical protein
MIEAARRAEFDYYQRGGMLGSRFIPTPDAVIKAMLEAAIGDAPPQPVPGQKVPAIVTAAKPKRRR